MKNIKDQYDIVIIGSGFGGLNAAYMLAKHGYSVCVLEKNAQIGGTLQTFYHDKVKFDTGIHYLGGLEPGQPLYPYFKYLGLFEDVEFEKMDENGFDLISFGGDKQIYPLAQGYENFKEQLLRFFPGQKENLDRYVDEMKRVCKDFSLYYLNKEADVEKEISHFYTGARDKINSIIDDPKLAMVVAANNLLYAGDGDTTPFYIHALVVNSYIESSYRVVGGGSMISRSLERSIKRMGGEIHRNSKVVHINYKDKTATSVELENGRHIRAKYFISNIHPTQTFRMIDPFPKRKAYYKRMLNFENTISAFTLYMVLKPGSYPYEKWNYYHFQKQDVWNEIHYRPEDWGKSFSVFPTPSHTDENYASGLIVIAYMRMEEVAQWKDTFNIVPGYEPRDQEYLEFKERKAQILLDNLEKRIPGIRSKIQSYTTSTPLTFRDYLNTPDGCLYGIARNYKAPMKTYVSARTKLDNLLLTGQNNIMHGLLGVAIGAVTTCSEIIGRGPLVDEIRKAAGYEG